MKTIIRAIAIIAVIAAPAYAQLTPDSDAPIDITGDAAEFQDNLAVWRGNVRVVQETSILVTDRLEAELNDNGDLTEITAIGNVRFSNGEEAITGRRAIFNNDARTITVLDDVIVTQGKQVLAAGAVTYWVDTGRVTFAPPPGGRIRGVFFPEDDEQT